MEGDQFDLDLNDDGLLGDNDDEYDFEADDSVDLRPGYPEASEENPGPITWHVLVVWGILGVLIFVGGVIPMKVSSLLVAVAATILPLSVVLYFAWYKDDRDKASWKRVSLHTFAGVVLGALVEVMEGVCMVLLFLALRTIMPTLKSDFKPKDFDSHPEFINTNSDFGNFLYAMGVEFFLAVFVAAWIEESFKWAVAHRCKVNPQRDFSYSVVIYTIATALGFAITETYVLGILISLHEPLAAFIVVMVLNVFLVGMHTVTATIIGADVAENKWDVTDRSYLQIIWKPLLIHGLFSWSLRMIEPLRRWLGWPVGIAMLPIPVAILLIGGYIARQRANDLKRLEDNRGVQLPQI
eukprot:TRINITY_DN348_c1_g1_i1.p1 TRINITY_DN348_c1_g1~~TRINITY_DN348_c1_g1_i1.p1  ORF type:complete len:353 (+),score=76.72 TRINITY_DN348_c1_g1_i1:261-1319(+)